MNEHKKDISRHAYKVVEAYLAYRDQPNLHANNTLIESLDKLTRLHGHNPNHDPQHPAKPISIAC